MSDILKQLTAILEQRKTAAAGGLTAGNSTANNVNPDNSYVAQLHAKGLNKILEKVGEEATETILAAKDYQHIKSISLGADADTDTEKQALIGETADLWFHTLVMLSHLGSNADEVLTELGRRFGVSGIDEKASRNKP